MGYVAWPETLLAAEYGCRGSERVKPIFYRSKNWPILPRFDDYHSCSKHRLFTISSRSSELTRRKVPLNPMTDAIFTMQPANSRSSSRNLSRSAAFLSIHIRIPVGIATNPLNYILLLLFSSLCWPVISRSVHDPQVRAINAANTKLSLIILQRSPKHQAAINVYIILYTRGLSVPLAKRVIKPRVQSRTYSLRLDWVRRFWHVPW